MIKNCQMVWLWEELFMAYADKVRKIRRNVRHNSKHSDGKTEGPEAQDEHTAQLPTL